MLRLMLMKLIGYGRFITEKENDINIELYKVLLVLTNIDGMLVAGK